MSVNQSGAMPTRTISWRPDSARRYLNPLAMLLNLWVYRNLIKQFTRREVTSRYRGSYLGILWSFVTPLVMLIVYTFVFSIVFKVRWGNQLSDESQVGFALTLFTGLIAFNVFSESIARAPTLIVSNPNYVKKVVFPLEILPVTVLGSAVVNSLFSLVILLLAALLMQGHL